MTTQSTFPAFRIHEDGARLERLTQDDLSAGEVVIRVQWSGINYKDALAATGGRIVRRFPLVGGVDLSGVVETSSDASLKPGDPVLVTGCGLSETRDGGYAGFARVPIEAVVKLPPQLSLRDAMVVGTAGFAAALAITQLEHNGLKPGDGPVAVTGATGGVGCVAIDMLAQRGYQVIALSRKPDAQAMLRRLGASEVLVGDAHGMGPKPLEAERWAAAIDNVGGDMLGGLIRSTRMGGSVAAVGLAGGSELYVSLMPFLLRGVNLLGVNSAATKRDKRLAIWKRIASDLLPRHLDDIVTRVVPLAELPEAFTGYKEGSHMGRTLVSVEQ
ncbi:MAG: YhdH/YhfP family quinone oxidoreductase [Pseudomonadota bacterium]